MGTSPHKNSPVRAGGAGRLCFGADGAYGAGFGGGDGLGHILAGDVAGDGHGQCPVHRKDFGAQAGALGAADAEVGIDDRFHRNGLLWMVLHKSMPARGPVYSKAVPLERAERRAGLYFRPAVWYNSRDKTGKDGTTMNIQIFGTSKSFDTKKAQRYFKERGIRFQMIDLKEKGMSRGEFDNVARAVGGWQNLVDPNAKDKQTLALLDALIDWQKEDKLFENQQLLRQPIVRNGRQATVGYQPDVWATWQ